MSGLTVTGEEYLKKNLSHCHLVHYKSYMYGPMFEVVPSR